MAGIAANLWVARFGLMKTLYYLTCLRIWDDGNWDKRMRIGALFKESITVKPLKYGIYLNDFVVWTMHFLTMSKRPTNASLIQCIGA
jgi:hypothetical protein